MMLNSAEITAATKKQQDFVTKDRIIKETLDMRNKLESLIYSYRDRLDGEFKSFTNEKEIEVCKGEIEKFESWLYDEGSDVAKEVYESKIHDLIKVFENIEFRFNDHQTRNVSANELVSNIEKYISIANSADEKYAHIPQNEREIIRNSCEATQKWLHENLEAQGTLALNVDPLLTSKMINDKIENLRKICRPILDKKTPTPSPTATPSPNDESTDKGNDDKNDTSSEQKSQKE